MTQAMDLAYKQCTAAVAAADSPKAPASTPATGTQPSDETIHTTANHPWLSANHGWVVVVQLHSGEPVRRSERRDIHGRIATRPRAAAPHGLENDRSTRRRRTRWPYRRPPAVSPPKRIRASPRAVRRPLVAATGYRRQFRGPGAASLVALRSQRRGAILDFVAVR